MRGLYLVGLLTVLVDFLLLLGTNRLTGCPPEAKRALPAALVGGLYSAACLLPGFSFLGSNLWRLVMLGVMAMIAFGIQASTIRRGLVFALLHFALGGAAMGGGGKGTVSLIVAAGGIWVLCGGGLPGGRLVPVELRHRDTVWKLTALRDTGNTLRDPITGEQVIVAGADMGQKLLGLTSEQLSSPAKTLTMGLAPGMRLIPYRTVDQPGAMLLAKRFRNVRVGSWTGDAIVAFAPTCIGQKDGYQMLIGGAV